MGQQRDPLFGSVPQGWRGEEAIGGLLLKAGRLLAGTTRLGAEQLEACKTAQGSRNNNNDRFHLSSAYCMPGTWYIVSHLILCQLRRQGILRLALLIRKQSRGNNPPKITCLAGRGQAQSWRPGLSDSRAEG